MAILAGRRPTALPIQAQSGAGARSSERAPPAVAATTRPGGERLRELLLPYLALVLIHLLSGLQMEQPLILADELGYLGHARYLSGAADLPDMEGRQFYHFGYSLFLLPAFWLFSEPVASYRAALVINALLASSLYFPLRFILASLLGLPAGAARWIAFACCLYPSLVLYSNYAWSENAVVPICVAAVALFGRYLASRSARDILLFTLVTGFLYTVHPRALPVLGAALAYLLLLAALRAVPGRHLLLCTSGLATLFVLTRAANAHLGAIAWNGGGEISAAKLAGRLLPAASFPALLERVFGQLLYLSLGTHGLFLLGLTALIWLLVRRSGSRSLAGLLADPVAGVGLFVLVTSGGVLLGSSALKLYGLHGVHSLRGAAFIHGRYNEAFAVVAVAFALAEEWRRRPHDWQRVRRLLVAVAALASLTAVVALEADDALRRQAAGDPQAPPRETISVAEVDGIAVPAVYPYVHWLGGLKLYTMAFAATGLLVLLSVAMRFSRAGGLVLLTILFAAFSFYNHRNFVLPRVERAGSRLEFASRIRGFGPIEAVSYDLATPEPELLPGLQYLLPETVFDRFYSRDGDEPASQAVVAGNSWRQARRLGARFAVASGRGSALWFLPGELQARLAYPDYEGVTLGASLRVEFQESGFYRNEHFAGSAGRWTNGAASLRVPFDPKRPPRLLRIDTLMPKRRRARLEVVANGVELWRGEIPPGPWSRTFGLGSVPLENELLIELKSDTFLPERELAPNERRRRLGIVVRGIRLTAADGFEDPAGPVAGTG